jgi:hypothetical protein
MAASVSSPKHTRIHPAVPSFSEGASGSFPSSRSTTNAWSTPVTPPPTPEELTPHTADPTEPLPFFQQEINALRVHRLEVTLTSLKNLLTEYEQLRLSKEQGSSERWTLTGRKPLLETAMSKHQAFLEEEFDRLSLENYNLDVTQRLTEARLHNSRLVHFGVLFTEQINRLQVQLGTKVPQLPPFAHYLLPRAEHPQRTAEESLATTSQLIQRLAYSILILQGIILAIEGALVSTEKEPLRAIHIANLALRQDLIQVQEDNKRLSPLVAEYALLNAQNKSLKTRVIELKINYDKLAEHYDAAQQLINPLYVPKPRIAFSAVIGRIQPVHQQLAEVEGAPPSEEDADAQPEEARKSCCIVC